MVSMYRGVAAESPSADRMWAMQKFRPRSKSTNVSAPQIAWRSSSRVTTVPARPASIASTRAGCACSFTGEPLRASVPASGSNSKRPNFIRQGTTVHLPTLRRWRQDRGVKSIVVLTACLAALLAAAPAAAHPAPFSYLDLHIEGRALGGTLVLHDFDLAHDLGISPELLVDPAVVARKRDAIRALMADRLVFVVNGRDAAWDLAGVRALPDRSGVELTWRAAPASEIGRLTLRAVLFPYDPAHQTFVNVYEGGSLVRQEVLNAGRPAVDFYTRSRQG